MKALVHYVALAITICACIVILMLVAMATGLIGLGFLCANVRLKKDE
jgi:hypothetical protein